MSGLSLRISHQLMQDQRLGRPLEMTGGFFTSRGPEGELDLFHVVTSGSAAGSVRNLQRDPKSATGWRQRDLRHTFDAGIITARVNPADGRHVVFAAADNEFAIDLYYAVETQPGTWGEWRTLDAPQFAPGGQVIKALAAESIGKALHLFAIVGPRPGKPWAPNTLWQIAWDQPKAEWKKLGETAGDFVSYVKLGPLGEGLLTSVQGKLTSGGLGVDLVHVDVVTGHWTKIAFDLAFRLIDVEEKRNGTSIIVFDQEGEPGPRGLRFIDGDDPSYTPAELPGTDRLRTRQILAVDGDRLPFAVYLIDDRNYLHVINRRNGGWEKRLNLGFAFSAMSGGLGSDGLPEIYGLTSGSERRLECIYKSPEEEGIGGAWRHQSLSLPNGPLQTIPVYTTDLAVNDAQGNPLLEQPVDVYASEHVDATANDRALVFGPSHATSVQTDAMGRITLVAGCTTLHTAKWRVQRQGDADGGPWIDVNDDVARRFQKITLAEVERLLPADMRPHAAKVHGAVTKAANVVSPAAFRTAERAVNGYRPLSGDIPDGAWSFHVDGGTVRFENLSLAEAQQRREAMLAQPDAQALDLFRWFSDAAQAIANQVAQTVDYVVTAINGVVTATFNLIIDGVHFVFNGVLRFVEQAFQVVESIWNAVKVGFGKLFELAGALLENFRQDVWQTKKLIEKSFYDGVDATLWLLDQSRSGIERTLRQMSSSIDNGFDRLLANIGDKPFDYHKVIPPTLAGAQYSEERIAAASALVNGIPRKLLDPSGTGPAIRFTDAVRQTLNNVAADFTRFGTTLRDELGTTAERQLKQVTDWLQTAAANPETLLTSTLRAFINTVRDFVKTTLTVSGATINLLLDLAKTLFRAMRDILRSAIDSPLLQSIYDFINPEAQKVPLTLGDLLFVACAAPVSLGTYVLTGKGFLRKSGPAHLQEEPLFDASDPERPRRFAAGLLRIIPWSIYDIGLTLGEFTTVGHKFLLSLLPMVLRFLQIPGAIRDWSTADLVVGHVHWILGTLPPLSRVPAAFLNGAPAIAASVVSAFLALHVLAAAFARIIYEIANNRFNILSCFVWITGPLPTAAGPIKEAGPKARIVTAVIKTVMHLIAGGVLCYQNRPTASEEDELSTIDLFTPQGA